MMSAGNYSTSGQDLHYLHDKTDIKEWQGRCDVPCEVGQWNTKTVSIHNSFLKVDTNYFCTCHGLYLYKFAKGTSQGIWPLHKTKRNAKHSQPPPQ